MKTNLSWFLLSALATKVYCAENDPTNSVLRAEYFTSHYIHGDRITFVDTPDLIHNKLWTSVDLHDIYEHYHYGENYTLRSTHDGKTFDHILGHDFELTKGPSHFSFDAIPDKNKEELIREKRERLVVGSRLGLSEADGLSVKMTAHAEFQIRLEKIPKVAYSIDF